MIVVFCLLVVLGLGRCQDNDLPSKFEIESSINRTIEEVERKVQGNSSLPRLTRQQIVNILQNITSNELSLYKDKEKMEKARRLYQRALMVVLPYNAEESPEALNDLYTKPPMTQMIPDFLNAGDDKDKFNEQKVVDSKKPNKYTATVPSFADNSSSTRESSKFTPGSSQSTSFKNRYKNHRETYSEVHLKAPLKETLKLDSAPMRFTFNLEKLQKNSQTTSKPHPVYISTGNEIKDKNSSKLEDVNNAGTTNTTSKEIAVDLQGAKTNVLSSNQWRYNAPPTTTIKPTTPSKFRNHEKTPVSPAIIKIQPEDGILAMSTTKTSQISGLGSLSKTAKPSSEEPSKPVYVTPMPTEPTPKVKYSSTYSLNSAGFRGTTTTSKPMRPEVMDLLASLGLRVDNGSNVEDVYKKNKEILESKFQIPDSNSVIYSTAAGLSPVGSDNTASIINQNTFESSGSEIKKGMDNLTPDVQLLFQRFGLQTSNRDRPATTTTQRTTVNLNSYTNFKPLPMSNVKDEGMKEFLAKFGLGVSDTRREKAMKSSTNAPSLIEAVPGDMRNILENIGLISKTRKAPRVITKAERAAESTSTTKVHVFKPHEVRVKDESQRTKINELLDTVRMVQEGKGDIQSVKKAANELLQTTKTLKDGPDPLSLEEIIKIYNEDVRNEVKRQQQNPPETTTVSEGGEGRPSTTTESSESSSTTTSTATDSAKAASDLSTTITTTSLDTSTSATILSTTSNLLALEESFGGTTRAPDPVIPTRPKSGLYFLVDWNTFLEVGEEDKGKVNLRFQPKVGDRSRFLPVMVP